MLRLKGLRFMHRVKRLGFRVGGLERPHSPASPPPTTHKGDPVPKS